MRGRRTSRGPTRGFTLVEILLALGIAALLVTLVYSSYQTFTRSSLRQQERFAGTVSLDYAFEIFRADLERSFSTELEEVCTLKLSTDAEGSTEEFYFCTYLPSPHESESRWSDLIHVSYSLQTDQPGKGFLWRKNFPVAGPGAYAPPQTNVIMNKLQSFRAELFDGEAWHTEWPKEDVDTSPRAIRITLTPSEHPDGITREIFLPTGKRVSPSGALQSTASP